MAGRCAWEKGDTCLLDAVPDWLLPVLASPFVGSFLGVVVRRLPLGRPVVLDRSCCEGCGRVLGARELVPVLSYLVQRGRCRGCGAGIAAAHLQIELAAVGVAVVAAAAGAVQGVDDPVRLWLSCGLGWALLVLAWIDWDNLRLPDALTLPLLVAGLGAALLLDPDRAPEHAAAAALGYLAFWLLARSYHALRGRDGLGGGDAKLLAAGGAWIGLEHLPLVVGAAALLGLLLAALQRWRGEAVGATTALPFGPGLCAAIWLGWLLGQTDAATAAVIVGQVMPPGALGFAGGMVLLWPA